MNYKNSELGSLFLLVAKVLLAAALVTNLVGCQPQSPAQNQVVFSGPIMGTDYRVTLILERQRDEAELKALETAIVDAMQVVNQSMSNYLPDSELSRFNRLTAGETQTLSADFTEVMRESLQISELSQGTFDVTLAKAIDAWGFGPDGRITKRPSAEAIEALRATAGYKKLLLEGNVLSKRVDGVEISLSAIAKGYAVDKVAAALEQRGITHFLINIGGELRASGKSIDGQLWRVGIEKPHILGGIQEVAKLNNQSIATSGDYRNYLVVDGEQFSHTIDSQTLSPIYHKLALVSVISDSATTADALATAMLAMDEKRAWAFAQKHELAAYLIIRGQNEGDYEIKVSDKFNVNLQ